MSFNKNIIYKCPICGREYINKKSLYHHIEEEHSEQLPKTISPAQLYFNYKNKYSLTKGNGKCVICGNSTPFNDKTEHYERFDSEKCRNAYREQFKQRMIKKYGKEHILDDPDQQKKMLANRKISGEYIWRDKKTKFTYTGSYEHDFIEFMDILMQWENPSDIMMPAPQIFEFTIDDKKHFYIPDVYITSLNLIIEIKSDENQHYRLRDINIEKTKDDILGQSNYEYLKLYDKKYADFFNYLINRKDGKKL